MYISTYISTANSLYSPKQQIFDSSKLNEFADDHFKFDENGRKFSLRAISPFPAVFSKDLYSRLVKIRACLGKDL